MSLKDEFAGLFIAVPDEAKNQLVYKWPNNSIRKLSAMIVDVDGMALFVSRGVVVGTFGPGRYKLDAKEWPFLGMLVDAATDGNAYRAELFFVSTKQFPNEKFGSKVDNVVDPRTGLVVSLLMHGEYAVKVTGPEKLILNLVGTGGAPDSDTNVLDWVDQQLVKSLRHYVTENVTTGKWPVLGLATYLPEIETTGIATVNTELEQYGLVIPKFGNVEVALSQEDEAQLKTLSKDTAYSQLAGSFGAYAAGSAMLGAGEGMAQGGSGGNPALLAAGLGIGGGMGGGMAANPSVPVAPYQPPTPGGAAAAPASAGSCTKCGAALASGAKFCGECGTPVPVAAAPAFCTKCGAALAPGAKFCGECGTPTSAAAAPSSSPEPVPGAPEAPEAPEGGASA